jgi:hypothetical protein
MDNRLYLSKLVDSVNIGRIPYTPGKPFILVDGILRTAHNTLMGIAIARAASEVYDINAGYLCVYEESDHYCDRLFRKAGIAPFEISSGSGLTFKLRALGSGLWKTLRRDGLISDLELNGVKIGDVIYDSIIRSNDDVYTLDHAHYWQRLKKVALGVQLAKDTKSLLSRNDVCAVALSHKVYARFGVPARMATASGATLLSKSRAHINRITTMEGHYINDYKVSKDDLRKVISKVGLGRIKMYITKRFSGSVDGHDVKNAFTDKKDYEISLLKKQMSISEDRPAALIAPHVFSDAPHSDRGMLYDDYYEWFTRTLDIIRSISGVQWFVKPHPSSEMYDEEGVVEELVRRLEGVRLVPGDAKTDSILRVSDAVFTVRGTIGMEALIFDCNVVLGGNAIYDDIDSVTVCKTEREYKDELRYPNMSGSVHKNDKQYAMAAIYYREKSYNYVSPLFGPERSPNCSHHAQVNHDKNNIETLSEFVSENEYGNSKYYKKLAEYLSSGKKRLSIVDLL